MAKSLIPNVVDNKTAKTISLYNGRIELFDPLIHPLVRLVQKHHRVSTAHPSYATVEQKPEGHGWHTDTGNSGHMQWCVLTASVLLTPPSSFSGGEFFYRDEKQSVCELSRHDDLHVRRGALRQAAHWRAQSSPDVFQRRSN